MNTLWSLISYTKLYGGMYYEYSHLYITFSIKNAWIQHNCADGWKPISLMTYQPSCSRARVEHACLTITYSTHNRYKQRLNKHSSCECMPNCSLWSSPSNGCHSPHSASKNYTEMETKILNTDSDPQNNDRDPVIRVIAIQQITVTLRWKSEKSNANL